MRKLIIVVIVLAVLATAGVLEQRWINSTFDTLHEKSQQLIEECEASAVTDDQVAAVAEWWESIKSIAHIYIKHDALNPIDGYFAEAEAFAKNKDYKKCYVSLAHLKDLAISIPKEFKFNLQNIL